MGLLKTSMGPSLQTLSHDKEQDGTQFLQIGVTMAKLWPLKLLSFFMKCIFVLNALFLYAPLCLAFANRVTYC